jgi:penicillin-binding protein 1A
MTDVHGIAVQGGTFPAMIWHDYMNIAHGSNCDTFPLPTTPVVWAPFYGHYATTGAPGSATGATGATGVAPPTTTPSNGTGGTAPGTTKGYDPRLYASPPQGPPASKTPSPHSHKPGGGSHGGGGSPTSPSHP